MDKTTQELLDLARFGVVSITSFDGHCVRIDFANREEAERMFELLATNFRSTKEGL